MTEASSHLRAALLRGDALPYNTLSPVSPRTSSQSMARPIEVRTARLLLRQWRDSDREPYAFLSADPQVMRFFAGTQSRQTSDRNIDVWQAEITERGWSNWAVEVVESGAFVGFIGLSVPKRALPFMPCVEVGYRLARKYWGHGYASEGARAALDVGFKKLGLAEIVSFTAIMNLPSRAVMQRIGMINANEDFDHPALPEGNELRRHCLYRISRERWMAREKTPDSSVEARPDSKPPQRLEPQGSPTK
jgi:RimJ/RimL family protein N-acetyltransferase